MPPTPDQIADDLRPAFRGRVLADTVSRGLYATDASPFTVTPAAVAVPRDAEDVAAVVRYCHEHGLTLTPRGGGTGLAGESLSPGLVLDLSVHFRSIRDIAADTVTVEAGVPLAELNAALAAHGRRFAPDPASARSCTIGGMIATDASGGTAFRHGYTRDHVQSLEVVWDTGETSVVRRPWSVGKTTDHGPRTTDIAEAVADLFRGNAEPLAAKPLRFDRITSRLTDAATPHGPDLVRLIVGAEGTLAVVTAATLKTVPLPGGVALFALGFASLDAAARAGADLRTCEGVAGADLLDQRLLSLCRAGKGAGGIGSVPPSVAAALVVQVEADSELDAVKLATDAVNRLRADRPVWVLAEPTADPCGTAAIRGFRDAAVSGLYALGAGRRPEAGIEDVAVPVEAVPGYVAAVQDILRQRDLSASFLIHALTGQVHARPLVDLADPADREKLWPIAEAVHSLALAIGGTVSSQHGVGIARAPWVERQLGDLLPLAREVKRIFDPKNIFNPGKLTGPDPSRPAWPLRAVASGQWPVVSKPEPEAARTALLVWPVSPEAEARKCTGCGDCRGRTGGRMCPVFRATGDELASPRALAGLSTLLAGSVALSPDAVKAVADQCVNCKMCREECRAGVDVPGLMMEAKAARHAAHGLDRADWLFARIESVAAAAGTFAFTANTLLRLRPTRWLLEKLLGLSRRHALPRFTHRTFLRRAWRAGLTSRPTNADGPKVAYFVDTFANHADPHIGLAAVAVLKHHGVAVHVPWRQRGSGMPALTAGDLDTARDAAAYNVRTLAELVRDGYTVVCSEPTAAVALTQEYPRILPGADSALVASQTVELTTYLWRLHTGGKLRTDFAPLPAGLGHHVPCHVKALRGPVAGPNLLALLPGTKVHTIDVGCSGMAGTWGLRASVRDVSFAAGAAMAAELDRPRVLYGSTECGACRVRMQHVSGKRTLHPVQYLALAYGLMPEMDRRLGTMPGRRITD